MLALLNGLSGWLWQNFGITQISIQLSTNHLEDVDSSPVTDLGTWLQERKGITELLQQQLLRMQQRMKSQADKYRSERTFAVGDQVWLKLQPYVQTSVARRASHKLAFKYFGPYEVESRVGSVAYKLKLPSTSTIHPVFHVSLLKRVTGPASIHVSPLPPGDVPMQVPEAVLDRRLHTKKNRAVTQLLIKWQGWLPKLATWEDEDIILPRLSAARACGQAVIQERGNVMVPGANTGRCRTERIKKPSTIVSGPEWLSK